MSKRIGRLSVTSFPYKKRRFKTWTNNIKDIGWLTSHCTPTKQHKWKTWENRERKEDHQLTTHRLPNKQYKLTSHHCPSQAVQTSDFSKWLKGDSLTYKSLVPYPTNKHEAWEDRTRKGD